MAASPEQLAVIGRIAANLVKDGDRVGLGSGRAAVAAVRQLGERVKAEGLRIVGVPTGIATEKVAREVGIPIAGLDTVQELDIAIDGADEVDPALNLLKGGGGNLTREKIVECIAKRFVVVVGEEKLVKMMGEKFPVFLEVLEFARPSVQRKLENWGFSVVQRTIEAGRPFLTDDGNPILHASVPPGDWDPVEFDRLLQATPGVVESGIFVDMATEVYVACLDGGVKLLAKVGGRVQATVGTADKPPAVHVAPPATSREQPRSKEVDKQTDPRLVMANVAGALLLASGTRALVKTDKCVTHGLVMLPGVMMLNRLPYAGIVGLAASLYGFILYPQKAVESAKSWPWPAVSAGLCAYLMFTKPGRFK